MIDRYNRLVEDSIEFQIYINAFLDCNAEDQSLIDIKDLQSMFNFDKFEIP